jgi:hypothetical protein
MVSADRPPAGVPRNIIDDDESGPMGLRETATCGTITLSDSSHPSELVVLGLVVWLRCGGYGARNVEVPHTVSSSQAMRTSCFQERDRFASM